MKTPQEIAAELRELAAELEAETGRVRWICAVFFLETPSERLQPGASMVRLSRNDAPPEELAAVMKEVAERVGQSVIPVG